MPQGPDGLPEPAVVQVAVGVRVGIVEGDVDGQQHVRRHLHHHHPALGVDPYEHGDDEVLVPAADPDAQEVPAALAALLDGGGPVRLEVGPQVRSFVAVVQPSARQEHATVDDQLAHAVQHLSLIHKETGAGVGERLRFAAGFEVLAGAQLEGHLPGAVRLTGPDERVVDVVHDHRRVLLVQDALPYAGEPYALLRFRRVGGTVGVPVPVEVGGDGPGDVAALESDDGDDRGEDRRDPSEDEAGRRAADALGEEQRAETDGAFVLVAEGAEEGQPDPEDEDHDDGEVPPGVDPHDEGQQARQQPGPGPQPAGEAQQQEREEDHHEGAPGEEGPREPGAEYADRPAEFGAPGAQGVGEDARGVEAVGGRDDALLVDVQLLDDAVAVPGVEVGARAQEAAGLADRRVDGGTAGAGVVLRGAGVLAGNRALGHRPTLDFPYNLRQAESRQSAPASGGRGASVGAFRRGGGGVRAPR